MSAFTEDLRAALDKDPAAASALEVFFTYPGFHAVTWYRVAHKLYHWKTPVLPKLISTMARSWTGVYIHPAAEIGRGLFIDHGAGVVIGETSIIGNDVTLFQGVTLGGTGKERGKRHPTLGDRVVVGAGAKIFGNIVVGDDVYVAPNSVVLKDVPANSTVVGVPGRILKREGRRVPSMTLDHVHVPDPVSRELENIQKEIRRIEEYLKIWEGGVQVSFLDESERPTSESPEAAEGEKPSTREGEDTPRQSAGN